MPARAPSLVDPSAAGFLTDLGARIRARRKALKVSAGAIAAAAGMSRQTLNRIERGEPSVTIGACVNVLQALGLEMKVAEPSDAKRASASAPGPGGIDAPASLDVDVDSVRVADFPQLRLLAWQMPWDLPPHPATEDKRIPGAQALAVYERNWRHVDQAALTERERDLIEALAKAHGNGVLLV